MKLATLTIILTAAIALAPVPVSAQEGYPSRTITIINPFAPGGGTDITGRAVAEVLSRSIGQPVIIENRPGAGGILGTELLANAEPDGYTLGTVITPTLAFNPSIYEAARYDPVADFAPVALIARVQFGIHVHRDFPATTFEEFVEYVKDNPGRINYASAATTGVVVAGLMNSAMGLEMNVIPFPGTGAAVADLVAGRVEVMISNPAGLMSHIEEGNLRTLAIMGSERYAALPDVPAMAELGFEEIDVTGWYAIAAPAGTDPDVIELLNREITDALRSPEVQRAYDNVGVQVPTDDLSAADLQQYIAEQVEFWAQVISEAGIERQ